MKNKSEYKKGDIVFNKSNEKFWLIKHVEDAPTQFLCDNGHIVVHFDTIGFPNLGTMTAPGTNENHEVYLVRYGNVSDIGTNMVDIMTADVTKGDTKEQGLRMQKLYREIKLKFLESY